MLHPGERHVGTRTPARNHLVDAAFGGGERYYCNEFCAEVEQIEPPPLVPGMREQAPTLMRFSPKSLPGGATLGSGPQLWGEGKRSRIDRSSSARR